MTAPCYVAQGYRPGGRWERILRVVRARAGTESEILHAIHDGRYSRKAERRKIHFAIDAMTRQGLLVRLPGGPAAFTATAHGVRTLEHGDA